jgi:hypothetical protein
VEKTARLEIDFSVQDPPRELVFNLFSPFNFSDPDWYGDYFQGVEILVNGKAVKRRELGDGRNTVRIEENLLVLGANLITLNFDYHLPFDFAPLWKTSALLEGIEFAR